MSKAGISNDGLQQRTHSVSSRGNIWYNDSFEDFTFNPILVAEK